MLIERPKSRPARWWPMLAAALAVTAVGSYAPRVAAESSASSESSGEVPLVVGQIKKLSFDKPMSRIAVGDPQVADVRPDGDNGIVVTGKAHGKTTLLVWFDDGPRKAYLLNVKSR